MIQERVNLSDILFESEPQGLKISSIKTKVQKFVAFFNENRDLPQLVSMQGEFFSYFDNFFYLGSAIVSGERFFPEINRSLRITTSVMETLNRNISRWGFVRVRIKRLKICVF